MKVKPLLSKVNQATFLADYLSANNVTDVERYLHPDDGCFDDIRYYPNINDAASMLSRALYEGRKIGLLVD